MDSHANINRQLIADIDQQFIDIVGPIGHLLIEDAKNLWRKKQWKGPSALRNYVKALSANIDSKTEREQFIQFTSQSAMNAAAQRKRQ